MDCVKYQKISLKEKKENIISDQQYVLNGSLVKNK